jgi:hypothetical protein
VVDASATAPFAVEQRAKTSRRPHQRRLADKILTAYYAACDEHALEVAATLLNLVAKLIKHPPNLPTGIDRRKLQDLTEAWERLWNLQYPSPWRTNAD